MCSELACPLCCCSTFESIEAFKLNLIKVNSKPIKCPLCDEILLGLDKLTIHLFGHSLPDESPIDKQSTQRPKKDPRTTQNRVKLVKISSSLGGLTEEKFRCEMCGFVFVDENLLKLHQSLVHNFSSTNDVEEIEDVKANKPEVKKFQCHLCLKHFKMKGALRIHIRVAHVRYHDQNKKQINIADYLKSQTSVDQSDVKSELLTFQDPYSSADNLLQPRSPSITSSPSYCAPSPQNSLNGDETRKCTDKNSKVFQCDECKKTFTTKYFLKKHQRIHTGEMPYQCEKCCKNFFFQQSFHKHKLYCYHNDEKPYECTECGRSFKELSTLHNHERIHSGIKPFGCEVCGKFFRQRVSYLVHSRIHTGVLPYKCSECGKCFRYKVSQRSHKCSGVLVKQPGDLIQRLIQNSSILPSSTVTTLDVSNETATENVDRISNSNQPQHESHELCLDDFLKEDAYDKMMKSSSQFIPQHHTDNGYCDSSVMAFNNLTINSNYDTNSRDYSQTFHNFPPTLETINEDSIKELLGALR